MVRLRRATLLLVITAAGCAAGTESEVARWERQARKVTIIRDDWGIAHVYGKTDADTVCGAMYAQAEDDFNRVETNYLNAMGRLSEAEGESKVYQDLRMKLFIDPQVLKQQYAASPLWLQKLMTAFADGLNYFLLKHPGTKPRVIQRFEPWMALSFTEGSIGAIYRPSTSMDCRRSMGRSKDRRCEHPRRGPSNLRVPMGSRLRLP